MSVSIHVYRDFQPRPIESHFRLSPADGPWTEEHYNSPANQHFLFVTDRPSLSQPLPLWTTLQAIALSAPSPEHPELLSGFSKLCGAGASGTEADHATLSSILAALRSFHDGWDRQPLLMPTEEAPNA